MYTSIATAVLLAMTTLLSFTAAIPVIQPSPRVPACGWGSPPPCACPTGTYLNQSTTTAVIGAPAPAVSNVMHSFFNTAWFGITPTATSGTDDTTSARRTFPFSLPDGSNANVIEGIHSYTADSHGGFKMEFDVANAPIKYNGGSYAGDWDTLQIATTAANETSVNWSIYSCYTGYNSKSDYPKTLPSLPMSC